MIVDGILWLLQGIVNVLLLPLEIVNVGIDFLSGIPIVVQFLQIVAYVIPWTNLIPIFVLVIGFFIFRALVALIKTIWDLLPIL